MPDVIQQAGWCFSFESQTWEWDHNAYAAAFANAFAVPTSTTLLRGGDPISWNMTGTNG